MTKKLAWICFLIVVLAPVCIKEAVGMPSYCLQVRLRVQERTIQGVEEVAFEASTSPAYFLLLANLETKINPFLSTREIDARYPAGFEPASTTIEAVDAVQSDQAVALPFRLLALPPALQTYSLEQTVLAVELPEEARGRITLRIRFITQIPRLNTGDHGIDRGIVTWRFGWYPYLLPDQENWEEVDGILEHRLREAFPLEFPAAGMNALVTLEATYAFACGADRVEEIPPSEESRETKDAGGASKCYRVEFDRPTRTLALVAGPNYRRYALDALPIPIEVFFLPGHDEEARLFATYAQDILADYQTRFAPYPRARLTIVENPNRNGLSMSADGIVFLSTLFFTHRDVTLPGILNRFCEFMLAHEIAHQWWGLGAGVDLNAENWLSEGLSQYLAVSYFEDRYGEFGPNTFELADKGILENLLRSQFGFLNLREHTIEFPYLRQVARGFDEAVVKPLAEVRYDNATPVRLYDKGYLVARAIAAAIGRETFEKGLREAGLRYRDEVISVEDLRGVLEELTDRSLEELFQVWLYKPGSVDYAVELSLRARTETGHRTVVKVSRDGGTVQPVTVEATLRSGKTVRQEWDGTSEEGSVIFDTQEPIYRVTIDPDHLLPDRERLNNNAPIKFVTITTTNLYPLDAYVLRLDPLSRGVTFSYLDRLRITLGEGSISAEVLRGKNHELSLAAGIVGGDLAGSIGYTFTAFGQPQNGSPGTYWEPDLSFTLAGHRLITGEGPLFFGHLEMLNYPSIQHSRWQAIGLDLVPTGAGRIAITAFDEVRIFPQIYLQGIATLGVGFGELPAALLFDLEELVSFRRVHLGQWVLTTPAGKYKLYGRLALEFPATEELFNLANMMLIDRVRASAFIAAGTCWTGFDEFGKTTPHVEAGVEAWFDLSAIGGLLPAEAVIGIATPILGEGTRLFYFGLSL